MKKHTITSLFLLTILLVSLTTEVSLAQSKRIRWGKTTSKERKLVRCDYDPSAEAVVLQSVGKLSLIAGSPAKISKYVRIKILSKEGLDWANVSIPFYHKDEFENIIGIQAQTINVLANGKTEVTKLKKNQIFTETLNETQKNKKFALPNVKVGSIIEYRYNLVTKATTSFDAWVFQQKIPTLYSYFTARFNVNADYVVIPQGDRLEKKYSNSARNEWALKNLPALRKEPFINNPWDYAEKIEIQLKGYQRSGYGGDSEYVEVMSSWPKLVEDVLNSESFTPYSQGRFALARKILQALPLSGLKPRQQVEQIYNKVRNHFTWNKYYGVYPMEKLKASWKTQKNNGAGINLWLVTLLKNAGMEAFPVLISTKAHGKILQKYPLLSKFNHLIASVKIGEKYYLMDAKQKQYPYQLLPIADLNDLGLILDAQSPGWVPLVSTEATHTKVFATLDVAKGQASVNVSLQGQEAYAFRKSPNAKNIVEAKVSLGNEELPLAKVFTKNLKDIHQPVQIEAKYGEEEAPDLGNIVYIKPVLWSRYLENPFKSPKRFYPIDVNFPREDTYLLNITLPKGYKVESVPKNVNSATADGSIRFLYQTKVFGNQLQVMGKVQFLKATIHHRHYGAVRELYSQIVEKYQEMIVLKEHKSK